MKKKKVLSGLLALAMTASLFAGCGKAAGTSTEGGSSAEVGGNEAAAASEGAERSRHPPVVIRLHMVRSSLIT